MTAHWRHGDVFNVRQPTERQLVDYNLATAEDVQDFIRITAGLPLGHMYGLGAHSLPIIRDVLDIVQPAAILELGFGAGASAAMFLACGPGRLDSVDHSLEEPVLEAGRILRQTGRFLLHHMKTVEAARLLSYQRFDLCFVDAGHTLEDVREDIGVCRQLGVPWVLFDDWWPKYGPGVQPAVDEAVEELHHFRQWGNMLLCSARWKVLPL